MGIYLICFVNVFEVSMKLRIRLTVLLVVVSAWMLSTSVYADHKKTKNNDATISKHKETTATAANKQSNAVNPVGNTQVILVGTNVLDPVVAARVRYEERLAELEAELEAEAILRQSQASPIVTDSTLLKSASEF